MKLKDNDFIFFSIILIFLVMIFMLQSCNEKQVNSSWRNLEIVVDGNDCDWKSYDKYYDKDTRTLTGIVNNKKYLYVFLSSHDQRLKRQIMEFGLTVWFDSEGGKKKQFGVHYPVGKPHYLRNYMMWDRSDRDSDKSHELPEKPRQRELQILGPEEGEQKTLLADDVDKYDINVVVGETEGNLVYELKIPLTQKDQIGYAVQADFSKCIGIGFETGDSDIDDMPARFKKMSEGPGKIGGGDPPGGADGGPPPGGMHGGRGMKMPEPLELWLRVKLASRF